jgi:hypothetical protein
MVTELWSLLNALVQAIFDFFKRLFPIRIQRLHLFTDNVDTFVAFDADDAERCYFEHVGETREDSAGDSDLDPYYQIKDNSPIKIWFEDEDDLSGSKPLFSRVQRKEGSPATVTAPAWAWIIEHGRGFLCSTAY